MKSTTFSKFLIISLILQACILLRADISAAEPAAPHQKPLWEMGLFNSAMSFPHYPGSNEQSYYVLPFPYFVYRGEYFRSDRDGFKGMFFKSRYLESSISLSGYPPIDGDNGAREGMPELGALFGVGPELKWHITNNESDHPLYLSTAIQGVSSARFNSFISIYYEGVRYSATLRYKNETLLKPPGSSLGISAALYYADADLNGFFYDVDQEYIRNDRPYYRSGKGPAGHSLATYVVYGLNDKFSVSGYLRWDNVSHAVFNDSPLVKQDDTFIVGISLIWKMYKSKKMVDAD
ncbi:MAG: MipA/OmpV family protein [Proteobacteria bacterium]|nr:MipA/OmpV family protein [Pseudomonadota bacterium]